MTDLYSAFSIHPSAFHALSAVVHGREGGRSDGASLWSAQVLGCDLAYMGTKFIATAESRADDQYKKMLVESTIDDVVSLAVSRRVWMVEPALVNAAVNAHSAPIVAEDEAARTAVDGLRERLSQPTT